MFGSETTVKKELVKGISNIDEVEQEWYCLDIYYLAMQYHVQNMWTGQRAIITPEFPIVIIRVVNGQISAPAIYGRINKR